MVFVQHARGRLPTSGAYNRLFDYGTFWGGVDIFLAISGFVICASACGRHRDVFSARLSYPQLKTFWLRRAWRLFPAAWFWLCVSIILTPWLTDLPAADVVLVAKSALYAIAGVSNAYWWQCVQHGGIGVWCPNPDINGVYWSLSLELQLYLLISLALFWGSMRSLIVLAVIACVAWPGMGANFTFAWSFRPQAFCMGILAYAFVAGFPGAVAEIPRLWRQIGIGICFMLVYLAPTWFPRNALALMAVASAGCVLLASADGALGRGRLAATFGWIGDRSYSIYLCHLPVLLALGEIARRLELPSHPGVIVHAVYLALSAALILVLSDLSFRFLERPATAWGKRQTAIEAR